MTVRFFCEKNADSIIVLYSVAFIVENKHVIIHYKSIIIFEKERLIVCMENF